MSRPLHRVPLVAVPLAVVLAAFGYLAGHRHPPTVPVSTQHTGIASVSSVLLEYPTSWRPVAAEAPVAGLPITQQLLLAPGGDPRAAGLIGGRLPGGEASPLPATFVAKLARLPRGEVVGFPAGQAYRYAPLRIPGFGGAVDLFAVPTQDARPTALVCYATSGAASYLRQCAAIVARLSLTGPSESALTPDAEFARRLGALIDALQRRRLALRREMARTSRPMLAGQLARKLADSFATAAAALAGAEPPAAARTAATELGVALTRARDSYTTLAGASARRESNSYAVVLRQLDAAERGVDGALESFALLGYAQA